MKFQIPDVRPGLLDETTFALLDDLRSFRHLFRNLYARPLDPEGTRLAQARTIPAIQAFKAAHTRFIAKLHEIANEIDDLG